MRSINRIGTRPASLPLSADDVVEFHAARLLLLFNLCGVAGRIDGLTKMAKLDFFARYPDFFEVAAARMPVSSDEVAQDENGDSAIESAMVRHHYGPWDKRYYHVLAHLEAKGLITVTKEGKTYRLALTDLGKQRARALALAPSFSGLVDRMRKIKKVFGGKSGTFLKDHIYKIFDEEVGRRPMGQVIE
ncbi:hypothetical protein SAMN06265365_117115 [Tistlia consotensis]|uniref:Winged helix DNA-binding domain-containing protein n=1 Tax=Tistlia consotensis USBA 355 TaxID=560819 RepID=A0A1Y6CE93_9PROT|nr:hypothetical protein [Tistlia consotensis]SMF51205.1 hypothetical protein SAMN05428998_1184 [Tistlia consotensis USBA 355]SNR84697.1 hypothetical protein SAMN06265365_117115 [Tistlia consotensis]